MEYFNSLYILNKNENINLYNLARLEAKNGNKTGAFKWLKLALEAGFNYTYVLKYDPALKNLRNDSNWKKMISSVSGKEYFSVEQNTEAVNF
jgi:hypothetical protein